MRRVIPSLPRLQTVPKGGDARAAWVVVAAALGALVSGGATAQVTNPCRDTHAVSVQSVRVPWEEATRTYANGAIRFVLMDTGEPACCAHHLVVLQAPEGDELDSTCTLVSALGPTDGFGGIAFADRRSRYDPAHGLSVPLTVTVQQAGGAVWSDETIWVTVNQATNAVTVD